jgi:predicted TIM-barrel fold metal-dependent hydrolase
MREPGAIDADGHITEYGVDWVARFPPELRDRAPRVTAGDHDTRALLIDGYRSPDPSFEGQGRWASGLVKVPADPNGMHDPRARLPDMDTEGIDVAVLYGTPLAFYANVTHDWRYAQAVCRAWNDWAAEYCAADPARLKFAALAPLGEMGAAIEEAQRAVHDLGAVGITFPPTYLNRSLDQTYFDPLYAALQALDVPVCVHGNTGTRLDTTIGRHDNWLITHALAFPMGLIHALASVVCGGVLERFPTLRVAFLEGGCGWLPFFMDRFDEHVEKLPALAPWLSKPPSEHIRGGQVFITCEPEEDLAYPLSRLGEDVIMYASDYAHWDSEFPDSARKIAERPELTEGQKAKILRENAARFYRLPVPAAV